MSAEVVSVEVMVTFHSRIAVGRVSSATSEPGRIGERERERGRTVGT